MLKKPVIGLVPMVNPEKSRCEMPWSYCNALEGAGALPMILPLLTDPDSLRQIVSLCSGILLTGGPDVDPARYGEQTLPACGTIIPSGMRWKHFCSGRPWKQTSRFWGSAGGSRP